jgi:predicted O-methyltransferase YrrM
LNLKFKKYWRKTGLSEEWGNTLLKLIFEKKPKHFLEIGVFCGVTSRNICGLIYLVKN